MRAPTSAGSGTVEYRYFDRNGVFQRSSRMEILAGDGGSEMGNALFAAIFNGKARLQMKALCAPRSRPVSRQTVASASAGGISVMCMDRNEEGTYDAAPQTVHGI